MLDTQLRIDRRRKPKDPAKALAEIIKRSEKIALEDVRAHDKQFADYDPKEWQSWYKLEAHIASVRTLVRKVAMILDLDEVVRLLLDLTTLLHDMGKVDPRYHFYRLQSKFTEERRLELRLGHMKSSGEYARNLMLFVRRGDRWQIERVLPMIEHHHDFWLIEDQLDRGLTLILNICDIFQSWLETRHRPGLKLPAAILGLQTLRMEAEAGKNPTYSPFVEDTRRCIDAILKVHEGVVSTIPDA